MMVLPAIKTGIRIALKTRAGVDDIAQVKKMHSWEVPAQRVITLLSAGNLATTQAVVRVVDERSKAPEDRSPSILKAPSIFQVATIFGYAHRLAGASG